MTHGNDCGCPDCYDRNMDNFSPLPLAASTPPQSEKYCPEHGHVKCGCPPSEDDQKEKGNIMNEQQEKMMQCVAGIAVFDHSYGRDELKALLLRELLTPDGITPLLSDENAACLADMFRGIAPTNTKEGTEAAIKAATAAIESLFTPSRKHQRMTPSERLRAAAAKLRAMNEAATAGQWGVSGWTGAPQFVTITGPVEEPLGRVEYPPKTVCSRATVTDSALIVALRNTATEQSAMMQAVADRLERGCSDTCSNALSSEYTCDCGHDALESAATAWCEAVEREGQ